LIRSKSPTANGAPQALPSPALRIPRASRRDAELSALRGNRASRTSAFVAARLTGPPSHWRQLDDRLLARSRPGQRLSELAMSASLAKGRIRHLHSCWRAYRRWRRRGCLCPHGAAHAPSHRCRVVAAVPDERARPHWSRCSLWAKRIGRRRRSRPARDDLDHAGAEGAQRASRNESEERRSRPSVRPPGIVHASSGMSSLGWATIRLAGEVG
jgi:hypothetical protein